MRRWNRFEAWGVRRHGGDMVVPQPACGSRRSLDSGRLGFCALGQIRFALIAQRKIRLRPSDPDEQDVARPYTRSLRVECRQQILERDYVVRQIVDALAMAPVMARDIREDSAPCDSAPRQVVDPKLGPAVARHFTVREAVVRAQTWMLDVA